MTNSDDVLREFDKTFTPENVSEAVTYHRDVTPEFVSTDPSMLLWAEEVPENPSKMQLEAIRLKWSMDVDEMFYVGDSHLPTPVPGLLNGKFGDSEGKSVLLPPLIFARDALANCLGGALPCKWLEEDNLERFAYNRDKLLFKLWWPKLTLVRGRSTYVGAIAPLELRGPLSA